MLFVKIEFKEKLTVPTVCANRETLQHHNKAAEKNEKIARVARATDLPQIEEVLFQTITQGRFGMTEQFLQDFVSRYLESKDCYVERFINNRPRI